LRMTSIKVSPLVAALWDCDSCGDAIAMVQ